MSKLYPNGKDKSLIYAIVNYLGELTKYKKKISEDDLEQIQVAKDTLAACEFYNNEDNKINFELQDLYNQYKSDNNNNVNVNNDSSDMNEIDEEKQKQFFDFVGILTNHKFFDGIEVGSIKYSNRLEKARKSYNKKYPNFAIESLDELDLDKLYKINKSDNNSSVNDKKPNANEDGGKTGKIDIKKGDELKGEGNKLLRTGKYKEAIKKYSEAINCNPNNAVYFSNMAAAYSYIKDFKNAAKYAEKATEIDSGYVKAWVRLGVASFELKNYNKAHDAYDKAVSLTPATNNNWELYMEKKEFCKQKMDMDIDDDEDNNNNDNIKNNPTGTDTGMPDLANLAGMFGGKNPNDLLNSMGGMAGIQNLMKNPMMKEMANNLMKNPDMMKNMMNKMGGMGGMGAANNNNNSNNNKEKQEMQKIMMEAMQNPEKTKKVWQQAQNDDEVRQLMQNPEYAPLIKKFQDSGEPTSVMMELAQKPLLLKKVQKLLKKYWK